MAQTCFDIHRGLDGHGHGEIDCVYVVRPDSIDAVSQCDLVVILANAVLDVVQVIFGAGACGRATCLDDFHFHGIAVASNHGDITCPVFHDEVNWSVIYVQGFAFFCCHRYVRLF